MTIHLDAEDYAGLERVAQRLGRLPETLVRAYVRAALLTAGGMYLTDDLKAWTIAPAHLLAPPESEEPDALMKELRTRGGHIRVLFAFDPRRTALLLLGGDKTGRSAIAR